MTVMADDFPIVDGKLTIRDLAGGFQPIDPPEGVSPLAFRTIVSGIYTQYMRNESLPTFELMTKTYTGIRRNDLLVCWDSPQLIEALDYRGVAWHPGSGLTIRQEMAIMSLGDPTDRRAPSAKLAAMGIAGSTYQAWMRNPLFKAHLEHATKSAYMDHLPLARAALIGNAVGGNQQAIELMFKITGEYDPAQKSLQDAETVVMTTIESVIRNVKDPTIRKAILDEVESAVVSFRVTNPRALEPPHAVD